MNPSTPRAGLLAGGNWITDHVKLIDAWPPQDALANIVGESWGNGGSPYNILKDLARLQAGFPLAAVGLIGRDIDGERILADCRTHGIDTTQLRQTPDAPTSYSDVMTDRQTGRRTFFHQRGANARLGPEHFNFTTTRAKIFHLGYALLLDGLDASDGDGPRARSVFRRARAAGLLTSLDCVSENSDRFRTIVRPTLPEVDFLFVNDFEAEKLTGLALRAIPGGAVRRASVEAAARALLGLGVRRQVFIHFPEAAHASSRESEGHWQPSVRMPPALIKGTAGAGDAFAAGVLAGLHAGGGIPAVLRLGVAAAASSLTDATCSAGVLDSATCLQLAATHGWHDLPA